MAWKGLEILHHNCDRFGMAWEMIVCAHYYFDSTLRLFLAGYLQFFL